MKTTRRETIKFLAATGGLTALAPYLKASAAMNGTGQSLDNYRMKKLWHGVCYYPELWPEEDVDRDIVEMQKLGINMIRIGEFTWSSIEPEEGKISTRFLREVMDKFHAAGIAVVFCTPTPTPPVWLTHNQPDRLFVNAEGERLIHGARQHVSYEHPAVRKACMRIVERIAKDLGDHPAIIAWQIDNELKCHVAEDFSPAAIAAWHHWLKKRYVTIDRLNKEWGTHMWSTHYQTFEQVPAPLKTPFLHNASLSTAYRLFNRESIAEFSDMQCKIIRQYSKAPITHNTNPAFSVNHERLFKNLDFAAYDAYPSSKEWQALVFRSDMYRAAKSGRPFWLMETSVSHNGWLGTHSAMHPEKFLMAEAVLVYGLGGEAINYWLWRQQRTGAEINHSAVMSSWFKPTIGYQQVKLVEDARKQLEPLMITSKPLVPEIAVTWSDHARAMIETEPMDKEAGFPETYNGVIQWWHGILFEQGYHRDVRFEGAALDGLKLWITPAMPYVSAEFLQRAVSFVKAGGIWLIAPGTGMRTREHTNHTDAGLGMLDAVAGVKTQAVFPLTATGITGSVDNKTLNFTGWCAAVKADSTDTKVLGKINSDLVPDTAFLTERQLGKGKIVLLSAHPIGDEGKKFIQELIKKYAGELNITRTFEVTPGTVVCPRVDDQGKQLSVVINMNGEGGSVKLPAACRDVISGKIISGTLHLKSYEWRVLQPGV